MKKKLATVIGGLSIMLFYGVFLSCTVFARPVTPADKRYSPFSGDVSECADQGVLDSIASGFASTQSEYWNSGLEIDRWQRVKELGLSPDGKDEIPHRFCQAEAILNDSSRHKVNYSIGEHQGFAGFGENVQWCVSGLDRNWAYNYNCSALQP